MWNKIGLYLRTIKFLKFVQVKYRIYYGLRNLWRKYSKFQYTFSLKYTNTYSVITLQPSIKTSSKYNDSCFSFLNLTKSFDKEKIDWNFSEYKKLWTYNLNYFEYLHQEKISKEDGLFLINDFIKKIDDSEDGLEPYPTSLRIIHWIKFLAYHKIQNDKIDHYLYNQIIILQDNLEYHILGNHLLENGFALFFWCVLLSR